MCVCIRICMYMSMPLMPMYVCQGGKLDHGRRLASGRPRHVQMALQSEVGRGLGLKRAGVGRGLGLEEG